MTNTPLCSVVLSTRNKAEELERTLRSIRRQSVPFDYELIVVDDGSTDLTRAVCQNHKVQYQFLENHRYRNPSVARNVGYRAARGKVIIAQSDDVVHVSPNAIEYLTTNIQDGEVLLAQVKNYTFLNGNPHHFIMDYCSSRRPIPYFFLGSLFRSDLYAIGGNDEDFVEPCFDDNWFSDCLVHGLKLNPRYTNKVTGYHQSHAHGPDTHSKEDVSKELYEKKKAEAETTGVYISSGGSWPYEDGKNLRSLSTDFSKENQESRTIPKRMSFFWSATQMSWMRYMTLKSFRHFHPDWDVFLYESEVEGTKTWGSSETQDQETYDRPNYYDKLDELDIKRVQWTPPIDNLAPAHASDLCEWEVLSTVGGFYADMDILFVKPMPYDTLKHSDVAYCLSEGYAAIGFFGATPGNRLFSSIRETAIDGYTPGKYQNTGADTVYRMAGLPTAWGRIHRPGDVVFQGFRNDYCELTFTELPQEFVYPFFYERVDKIFNQTHELPEECCGIHWFGGSTLAQTFNNFWTADNYRTSPNTFTKYAEEILGPSK